MADEPIKILGDILRTEMKLRENQTVLWNVAFPIPKDDDLYISLSVLGGRTFGNVTRYVEDAVTTELVQEQAVHRQEIISILAYSKGSEARTRNYEILMALRSDYSQQLQEKNSIKIPELPSSFNDVSIQDGAARLTRFAMTFALIVAYRKRSGVTYFNDFPTPKILTNP